MTHQPLARLHERAVHAVDLVVEAARVAQVVAGGVAPPQRRVVGPAVHALAPLLALAICRRTTLRARSLLSPLPPTLSTALGRCTRPDLKLLSRFLSDF